MDSYLLRNRLRFVGTGSDLFGIYIVNLLLTIVTLGFYYPWAKAATLKYTYANTLFDDSPFQFHGTGRELFMGFIRAVGIIVVLYGSLIAITFLAPKLAFVGLLVFYAAFLALIPIAVHGALRYRMSRTSWRGIHFGYRGDRGELVKLFLTQALLTIITFGIYGAWLTQNTYRYTISNIRAGSAKMHYSGDGGSYFGLVFGGYLLTLITFGIYGFWWGRDLFNYFVDNLSIEQDEKIYNFQSSMTVGDYFSLVVVNVLLTLFTLGLATPWVMSRSLKIVFDNVLLDERFDANALIQTESDFKNATGEDMADMLDLGLI